ncbi:MAG: TetR/AcrR family transcriptional regulator [Sphingobacteriales bacterium]|nr:TetR/AcrR family transcriptional regulator [Sphingobacteriales bacterium]
MPLAKRKKSAKKELIIKKASAMFREKGYPATSMRDLAEEIGLEAASLYNHIQSKSEMLQEIIFRTADECLQHLESLDEEDTNCVAKIESLIRFHVRMMLNRFDDYYVMTNEWIHLKEPHLSHFTGKRRYYVQKMESIIEAGLGNKTTNPGMSYTAMLTILAAVRGLEFWHRSAKKIAPGTMEDNMVALLISGLTDDKVFPSLKK